MTSQAMITTLYQTHGSKVRGAVRRTLRGTAVDVDDVLQDVWMRAWERSAQFRHESAPSTWLYRIAVNVAIDARRVARRTPENAGDPSGWEDLGQPCAECYDYRSPELGAVASDLLARVRRRASPMSLTALDGLERGERVIDTARRLGVHPTTMKTRRYRLRALTARVMGVA